MKTILHFLCILMFSTVLLSGPPSDEADIKEMIKKFSLSGDKRDVTLANAVLHKDARQYVTSDRFEGGLFIVTSEQYASLLAAGKIGGIPRSVDIQSIEIDKQKKNAVAQVQLTSEKAVFYSFICLSKISDGSWVIVSVLTSTAKPE